jgi:hypothetical protein
MPEGVRCFVLRQPRDANRDQWIINCRIIRARFEQPYLANERDSAPTMGRLIRELVGIGNHAGTNDLDALGFAGEDE